MPFGGAPRRSSLNSCLTKDETRVSGNKKHNPNFTTSSSLNTRLPSVSGCHSPSRQSNYVTTSNVYDDESREEEEDIFAGLDEACFVRRHTYDAEATRQSSKYGSEGEESILSSLGHMCGSPSRLMASQRSPLPAPLMQPDSSSSSSVVGPSEKPVEQTILARPKIERSSTKPFFSAAVSPGPISAGIAPGTIVGTGKPIGAPFRFGHSKSSSVLPTVAPVIPKIIKSPSTSNFTIYPSNFQASSGVTRSRLVADRVAMQQPPKWRREETNFPTKLRSLLDPI